MKKSAGLSLRSLDYRRLASIPARRACHHRSSVAIRKDTGQNQSCFLRIRSGYTPTLMGKASMALGHTISKIALKVASLATRRCGCRSLLRFPGYLLDTLNPKHPGEALSSITTGWLSDVGAQLQNRHRLPPDITGTNASFRALLLPEKGNQSISTSATFGQPGVGGVFDSPMRVSRHPALSRRRDYQLRRAGCRHGHGAVTPT